ncbi:hypothetical protein MSAN_02357500 [Mycena sanguinolenta]|uniref:Uncharacterized protein n=1 Tax=Mycena sanguinolenta TaxID=230812 RepID=A0A8H6X6A6_9AGAR|nr:hypothetical protein MSAN_02357500 [Mycena sanguinolenta]
MLDGLGSALAFHAIRVGHPASLRIPYIRYTTYITPRTTLPVALICLPYPVSYPVSLHPVSPERHDARDPVLNRLQPAFGLFWAEGESPVFGERPARDLFRIARSAQVIGIIARLSHLLVLGFTNDAAQAAWRAADIDFIVLLPPCDAVAELFPLIGSVNPDYIFDPVIDLHNDKLASITSWLKNTPSAPTDLIRLWEDYAFMFSINTMQRWNTGAVVQHIDSPSPELLRILISMRFLNRRLWELPTKLDLTWTDLRTTLCNLRPNILPFHQPHTGTIQAARDLASYSIRKMVKIYSNTNGGVNSPACRAARDLALQFIRKMVKNHIDTEGGLHPAASQLAVRLYRSHSSLNTLEKAYTQSWYYLGCDIAYLIRLSPPCPELYRELWSIPPSEIWSSWPSGDTLIHYVSKWLESFPNSTMALVMSWRQAAPAYNRYRIALNFDRDVEERRWCYCIGKYNDQIVELHLPDSLKIILST